MESFSLNSAKSFIGKNVNLHLKDGSVIVNVHLTRIRKDEFGKSTFVEYTPYRNQKLNRVSIKRRLCRINKLTFNDSMLILFNHFLSLKVKLLLSSYLPIIFLVSAFLYCRLLFRNRSLCFVTIHICGYRKILNTLKY